MEADDVPELEDMEDEIKKVTKDLKQPLANDNSDYTVPNIRHV